MAADCPPRLPGTMPLVSWPTSALGEASGRFDGAAGACHGRSAVRVLRAPWPRARRTLACSLAGSRWIVGRVFSHRRTYSAGRQAGRRE